MKILVFVLMFITTYCSKDISDRVKYDYILEISYKSKKSYSSIILETAQDTIYKYFYYDLDSNFRIKNIDKYNHLSKEPYENNDYFLDGVLKLRLDAKKGEEWKTKYENDYYDSLTVSVLDVIIDTTIVGIEINECYVYDLKYNRTAGEDYMDYRLYFDPKRKVTLRKEYYSNDKLKGKEVLIKETYIKN